MIKHFDQFILLELAQNHIEDLVRQMAVASYAAWAGVKPSELRLSTFESGMTNRLYRAQLPSDGASASAATMAGAISALAQFGALFGGSRDAEGRPTGEVITRKTYTRDEVRTKLLDGDG